MYTKIQKQIIVYTEQKVKKLFIDYPVVSHNFDHINRVRRWVVEIARAEKANIFLCELSALLHDVGRTLEKLSADKGHQELSYELVQKWFREDKNFDVLSQEEKIIVLYAIRYHWNNAAVKYFEAIILRDADKLDLFGKTGLKREIDFRRGDMEKIMLGLRLRYDNVRWIATKAAWNIFVKNKMLAPIDKYYLKNLKKQIEPVEL